jgi:hypothetical protein
MGRKLARIERKELRNTVLSKSRGSLQLADEEIAKAF